MTVSDHEYDKRNDAVDSALDALQHKNGRLDWKTVAGWIITVMLAYGAVEARVRVLEDRYERMGRDISEIKANVWELVKRP